MIRRLVLPSLKIRTVQNKIKEKEKNLLLKLHFLLISDRYYRRIQYVFSVYYNALSSENMDEGQFFALLFFFRKIRPRNILKDFASMYNITYKFDIIYLFLKQSNPYTKETLGKYVHYTLCL